MIYVLMYMAIGLVLAIYFRELLGCMDISIIRHLFEFVFFWPIILVACFIAGEL